MRMAEEMERETVLIKFISRIQRKLADPETKQEKVIKYLENLQKLPVSVNILKLSGVGKTVNKLKKQDNAVGSMARDLIMKWKDSVSTSPQKSLNERVEVRIEEPKASNIDVSKTVSKWKVKTLIPGGKDHWKDVSLDLLGEKAAKKMPDKSRHSISDAKKAFEENTRKKSFMELRNDQIMPSLPEIKLPELQKTYRPIHFSHLNDDKEDHCHRKKANFAVEDLESIIVSRKSRTQVFSGKRSHGSGVVQSLYNQCMRILAENIDALEDTGGVPFQILEPILAKVSPAQLIRLEEFNPYFTEDSSGLWKQHCEREFRGSVPDDIESWRELYLRKCAERSEKLKSIQSKISASQSKKEPLRQAKLAYIAEPSTHMRRRKLEHGTREGGSKNECKAKKLKAELDKKHKNEAEHTISSTKVVKHDRWPAGGRRTNARPELLTKRAVCKPMMKAAMKMMKNQRSRSVNQIMRK